MIDPGTDGEALSKNQRDLQEFAREVYADRLRRGVAREQARNDLPVSTFTAVYWHANVRSLTHFLGLRCDPHSQAEIREPATLVLDRLFAPLFPLAAEAFRDYRAGGGDADAAGSRGRAVRRALRLGGAGGRFSRTSAGAATSPATGGTSRGAGSATNAARSCTNCGCLRSPPRDRLPRPHRRRIEP